MSARATLPHQSRPNRRYRRLLPTALAVAAVASSVAVPSAHAADRSSAPPPPERRLHRRHTSERSAILPRAAVRAERGGTASGAV